ncbi:MAG TPA: hypothetical protein VEA63_13935 [Opitutus sp.]|nr:hypothetical protein [Opitutus sp.]
MSHEQDSKAAKIRSILRETFGDKIDAEIVDKVANRALRAPPVFHPRKTFPGAKR